MEAETNCSNQTSAGPEVLVQGLEKRFDQGQKEVVAIENIDLSIDKDEFVVILGPSGCGKSTLLSILAGYEKPTSGQVLIAGEPVQAPGPDHFMVFQSPALFPWLTTRQNITIGLKERGLSPTEIETKSAELITAVGLVGFETRYPYLLSGGMQQRVQLARALIHSPRVMLMDEPFGALDFQTRSQMQELLLRIWESYKHTVVFITHDVDEALLLADRIVLMTRRPGRISTVIDSEFHRPRDLESLPGQPGYVELRRRIMQKVREEVIQA